MTDAAQFDSRVKNKLEKQDEIEMSDEEEAAAEEHPIPPLSTHSAHRRHSKKGSPAPNLPVNPKITTDKLTKQAVRILFPLTRKSRVSGPKKVKVPRFFEFRKTFS